jgi:hypothetical protein
MKRYKHGLLEDCKWTYSKQRIYGPWQTDASPLPRMWPELGRHMASMLWLVKRRLSVAWGQVNPIHLKPSTVPYHLAVFFSRCNC